MAQNRMGISLADAEGAKQGLVTPILDLWDLVNDLKRLGPA
jgi:hypothetical protein